MRLAWIALGGAIGSLARWGLSVWFPTPATSFPWATFGANLSGAFVLGLAGEAMLIRVVRWRHLRSFLAIGLIGSYTTFSSMAMEGVSLGRLGKGATAIVYGVATLGLGLAAAIIGMATARRIWARRRQDGTQG